MSNSNLVKHIHISPNRSNGRKHVIDTITIHHMAGDITVETCGNIFASPSRQASSNYGIDSEGNIAMYVEEKDRSWCTSSSENDNRAVTIEVANCGGAKEGWPVSTKAYNALIELCVDICKRNGIKKLLWKNDKSLRGKVDKQNMTVHCWYKNKVCPGPYLMERMGDIAERVNKKLGVSGTSNDVSKTKAGYTKKQFISDLQEALGVKVTGSTNKATLAATITLSANKNNKHAAVIPVQKRLKALGYTEVGSADGIAGTKFTSAVKSYQKEHGCISDGEITAKKATWKSLLGM